MRCFYGEPETIFQNYHQILLLDKSSDENNQNSSRRHSETFFLFFPEIPRFNISCKLSPKDNLHEISNPIIWEEPKRKKIKMSSAGIFSQLAKH